MTRLTTYLLATAALFAVAFGLCVNAVVTLLAIIAACAVTVTVLACVTALRFRGVDVYRWWLQLLVLADRERDYIPPGL